MNTQQSDFYLYHTSACHLCEEAEKIIYTVAQQLDLSYMKIDIADDDDLLDKYGIRIPVLFYVKNQAELGWPFDAEQARQFMVSSC